MPWWTEQFEFQWAEASDISKLLGTPFGIDLSSYVVNQFLINKIDKKLIYWAT
jgi:hypothetical protein